MVDLLTTLLRSVFPPRDTELTLDLIDQDKINKLYNPNSNHDCLYLTSYSNQLVQSAIIENKFHNNQKASLILGKILQQSQYLRLTNAVFIPIPLGKQRFRERGYNQVLRILKKCPATIQIDTRSLTRSKETLAQSELNKNDRLKNLKNAFVFDPTKLKGNYSTIILFDDVLTTGATLESAKSAVTEHLGDRVKIICLAIAH
jgi:ComF family protein